MRQGIVFVLLLCVCFIHSHKIDDIIQKHWNNVKNNPKFPIASGHGLPFEKHTCIHEKLKRPITVPRQITGPTTEQRSVRTTQPMRFYYDFSLLNGTGSDPRACYSQGQTVISVDDGTSYTCKSTDVVTPEFEALIRDAVLPAVVDVFSTVLQVKYPASGNLVFDYGDWLINNKQCYDAVPIPQRYTQSGVPNTDYILFPTLRPTDTQTVAYALACMVDKTTFRPIGGHINFNPLYFQGYVNSFSEFSFASAVRVGIHELTHALGFSPYFYSYFLDDNGYTYSATATKYLNRTTPAGVAYNASIAMITSPHVVNFTKAHYKCDTMEGAELEDYGGSGTAGAHWESRTAGNEYMIGYVGDYMVIAGLTLSLFEDMGWYIVDKSKAEYYGWGKEKGCGFAQDQCHISWPLSQGYWCNTSAVTGCSGDRLGKAGCSVISGSTLQNKYQHFINPKLGGTNPAADYCPYFDISTACHNKQSTADSQIYEVYGYDSVCWEYSQGTSETLNTISFAKMASTIACWEHTCNYSADGNATLFVKINANFFECPYEGGIISVDPVIPNGFVNCPTTSLLCEKILGFSTNNNIVVVTNPFTSATTSDSTISTSSSTSSSSSATSSSTSTSSTSSSSTSASTTGSENSTSSTSSTTSTSSTSSTSGTTSTNSTNGAPSFIITPIKSSSNGLSTGGIVGIVIAILIVAIILAIFIVYFLLRRNSKKQTSEEAPTQSQIEMTASPKAEPKLTEEKPIEKPKEEPKPVEQKPEPVKYNPPILAPKDTDKKNYADLYPDWAKEVEKPNQNNWYPEWMQKD